MSNSIQFFKLSTAQQTRAQICAKITQLDALISSLYTSAITSVNNGDYASYEIDTGQTKQKVQYKNLTEVTRAIDAYELLREKLQAKLAPRVYRAMDGKNFRT